jgi:serine/threonine protein kinase
LCNGGDLRQYLTKKKNHLPEKEAILILQDMLKGLKEMVKNGFVHRDLKPENTFIHDNIYKIADFGFCQKAVPSQKMDTYLG